MLAQKNSGCPLTLSSSQGKSLTKFQYNLIPSKPNNTILKLPHDESVWDEKVCSRESSNSQIEN